MDDLSGLNWAGPRPSPLPNSQRQESKGNYYPTLHPTPPLSGRSTPSHTGQDGLFQRPTVNSASGSRGATPNNDSFANLVTFNPAQPNKNLSLQDQQRALQEQRARAEEQRRRQFDSHFGSSGLNSISTNQSGSSTPSRVASPLGPTSTKDTVSNGTKLQNGISPVSASISKVSASNTNNEDEADILAAFSSSAPVDKSSHMPPASQPASRHVTGTSKGNFDGTPDLAGGTSMAEDDDDPFGLGAMASKKATALPEKNTLQDTDDVLGDLSKPVSEFSSRKKAGEAKSTLTEETSSEPVDQALAELMDMGFPAEKARQALESTESGIDVQAAVGWLLNQAHEDSRKDKPQQNGMRRNSLKSQSSGRAAGRRKSSGGSGSRPAWMREEERVPQRHDSKSPSKGEKDPAQLAQELGSNLFKTANSIWKTSTKKINRAVADFNTDVDPSQPKWMREVQVPVQSTKSSSSSHIVRANNHDRLETETKMRGTSSVPQKSVTDEALLLESADARPQRKMASRTRADPGVARIVPGQDHMQLPVRNRASPAPSDRPFSPSHAKDPRSKLSRQAVEDEASQAYISPSRRRKPAASTVASIPAAPKNAEPDLLVGGSKPASRPSQPVQFSSTPTVSKPPATATTTLPTRPSRPKRDIPPISPRALAQATTSRQAGTASFKRGDYAEATTHYTSALSAIPTSHPLVLPILTNRALSHLKTGDPKASIADAKTTLEFIGLSRGQGETVDLGGSEGTKPMELYWGKAMTRQAEALEQLEKWPDAAAAWRSCVEAGVGGATSIAGRNRTENAARPKTAPVRKTPARPPPRPSALGDLAPATVQSAEAVSRLRAANAAADKLDDEKFKLADQVDARILKWRQGKESNLRALLSSLETVLWDDAGWKKVGMGDVLQPNKVKIIYMKGIAKVHPDKLSTSATTEQKMISAAVFATLNEAWEKFKQENGL